ncbi:MAG TPA: DUF4351 domain-containing protein [Gammaproteobacteria bacterium]|nr:DUF4351 domain-containing protein [Gammaproteobacteria bacterium]
MRRLPIISIAILIDDDPNWRINHYREECFGTYLEVGYIVVKLLDYQHRRQELAAINNRFAIIMLAQLTVLETKHNPIVRLKAKTALTRLLYERGYSRQDIIQLFTLIDWLVTLPEELVIKYNETLKEIEEEKQVDFITTPERVGIQKGIQQGFQQGLKTGLQKGEAALLIRLLQHRFHHLPSNYLTRIQQADSNTLLIWGERVLDANTLEEVFE